MWSKPWTIWSFPIFAPSCNLWLKVSSGPLLPSRNQGAYPSSPSVNNLLCLIFTDEKPRKKAKAAAGGAKKTTKKAAGPAATGKAPQTADIDVDQAQRRADEIVQKLLHGGNLQASSSNAKPDSRKAGESRPADEVEDPDDEDEDMAGQDDGDDA